MTTDATIGQQIVNYQTMQSFVTAATAGIPTGGSDVSSLSGNWESTYTTVQANSATWEAGGGGGSLDTLTTFIDQAGGTSDTYGVLSGAIDGVNTTFTVSESAYTTGSLKSWINGQLLTQGSSEDWTETTPISGIFDFIIAPLSGDEITVEYQTGDGAFSGNLTADNILINNTVVFASEYDNGNSGDSFAIDWSNGNKQKITLTESPTATFVDPAGVGNFLLKVAQVSGSDLITWPTVLWPSGTTPTLSVGASAIDIITFYYDGSSYYGVASLDFQ